MYWLPLPKEIQREIVSKYSNNNKNAARSKIKKRSIKDLFKNQTCKNNTTAAKKKKNITSNRVPNCFHDIDSNVFAALPENIRSEFSNAYNNTRNNKSKVSNGVKRKKKMHTDGKQQKSLYDLFQHRK